MPRTALLSARIIFALLVFAALALVIAARPAKRLIDFDQSFYLTIAYDLDRHGVFSNGIFDDVDSTRAIPPPGMFFGPAYPWLIVAATKIDSRFSAAVECSIEANHNRRDLSTCEIYARPMLVMHALFLALGVLAIALTAEALFASRLIFYLAGAIAAAGLVPEAELFSFVMTESVAFGLYSLSAFLIVLGWKTSRSQHFALAGLALGVLCLTRPSFVVLTPVVLVLTLLKAWVWPLGAGRSAWTNILALAACFLVVIMPWVARNYVSVGKWGLTEEYGAAAVIERFAFNDMTAKEFVLAFPYCVPQLGPEVVRPLAGAEAMDRFQWDKPGSFFDQGRARRIALTETHKKLDPVFGAILRDEINRNWWRHLLVSVPLAWCGLWVGGIWSLVFVPMFAWACASAVRRSQSLFLLYAAPALIMVGVHAAVANHYSRYNLGLIGPIAAGSAWMIARAWSARWSGNRTARQRA